MEHPQDNPEQFAPYNIVHKDGFLALSHIDGTVIPLQQDLIISQDVDFPGYIKIKCVIEGYLPIDRLKV